MVKEKMELASALEPREVRPHSLQRIFKALSKDSCTLAPSFHLFWSSSSLWGTGPFLFDKCILTLFSPPCLPFPPFLFFLPSLFREQGLNTCCMPGTVLGDTEPTKRARFEGWVGTK